MTAKHAPLSKLLKDAAVGVSEVGESFTPDGLYPPDHEFGMEVPEGGSACSKCKYLDRDTMTDCKEEHFTQWNGGPRIKGKITAYCCDDFEAAKSKPLSRREAWDGMSDKEILDSDRAVGKEG